MKRYLRWLLVLGLGLMACSNKRPQAKPQPVWPDAAVASEDAAVALPFDKSQLIPRRHRITLPVPLPPR